MRNYGGRSFVPPIVVISLGYTSRKHTHKMIDLAGKMSCDHVTNCDIVGNWQTSWYKEANFFSWYLINLLLCWKKGKWCATSWKVKEQKYEPCGTIEGEVLFPYCCDFFGVKFHKKYMNCTSQCKIQRRLTHPTAYLQSFHYSLQICLGVDVDMNVFWGRGVANKQMLYWWIIFNKTVNIILCSNCTYIQKAVHPLVVWYVIIDGRCTKKQNLISLRTKMCELLKVKKMMYMYLQFLFPW